LCQLCQQVVFTKLYASVNAYEWHDTNTRHSMLRGDAIMKHLGTASVIGQHLRVPATTNVVHTRSELVHSIHVQLQALTFTNIYRSSVLCAGFGKLRFPRDTLHSHPFQITTQNTRHTAASRNASQLSISTLQHTSVLNVDVPSVVSNLLRTTYQAGAAAMRICGRIACCKQVHRSMPRCHSRSKHSTKSTSHGHVKCPLF
jgi:hypothetical protein